MTEKILIIDDDLDTLRLVGLMLQREGYEIVAATNGQQGIAKAERESPDLIVLDIMMPEMDGYEVARRLRANPLTSDIPILMFTAKTQLDDKVVGFEVGADDYLTKPTHPSEFQAHVRALLKRSQKMRAETSEAAEEIPRRRAFTIGILAARGGMGVSTIAANLGASLLAQSKSSVIVAELTPGQGTLSVDLGLTAGEELSNLLVEDPTAITYERVKQLLVKHPSGLLVLPASDRPRDVHLIDRMAQFEALFNYLKVMAPFIIVDFGAGLPPFAQKLLPRCDEKIVVVEGKPNLVAHTQALLDDLGALGIDPAQVTVVLNNRVRSETQLSWMHVQERLGHPVAVTFTPAPELFDQAGQKKTLAVLYQPQSLTGQQFSKLASLILERAPQAAQ